MKENIQKAVKEQLGSLCEVLTNENRLLFVGVIGVYDETSNQVQVDLYKGDATPYGVIYNTEIKLRVHSVRGNNHIVLFQGRVIRCASSFWKIELKPGYISCSESREAFRQSVRTSGILRRVSSNGKAEEQEIPCKLVDISLTGVCFESTETFQNGERLVLSDVMLSVGGSRYQFNCEVVRSQAVSEDPSSPIRYGCRFLKMPIRQEDLLCRDIMALQIESLHS